MADTAEGPHWWSYDAFGRQVLVGYWQSADSIPPVSYAKNAAFNAAGQLTYYELDPSLCRGLSIYSATRGISLSYNALGQLTSQTSVTLSDSYTYSATANDGRILGRTVYTPFFQSAIAYGYDSLGRLTTADATGAITNSSDSSRTWGQSFVYDPFGNLLQQNVTRGSAPALSLYVDSSTNRIAMQSFTYDAAGNLTQTPSGATLSYDSENRLSRFSQSGSTTNYYNGVNGERLFDGTYWYLYGPDGYQARLSQDSSGSFVWQTDDMSLSGKQVVLLGKAVLTDRVGSLFAYGVSAGPYSQMTPAASLYYPYGQPPGVTYTDRELYNFATYANDGNGLYYAKHRYYDFARGRFTSPDPYNGSMDLRNPLSFNRYSYVMGDPVNKHDPTGLCPPGMVEADSDQLSSIIDAAESYLGQGLSHADKSHFQTDSQGNLTAIDCSGLVSQAMSGISYVGGSAFKAATTMFTTSQTASLFSADPSFQVGDIIWFFGHVGIVNGVNAKGQATSFIGSQSNSGPAVVDLTKNPYWANRLSGAKAYKPCVPAPGKATTAGNTGYDGSVFQPSDPWSSIGWVGAIPIGGGVPNVTSTIRYDLDL